MPAPLVLKPAPTAHQDAGATVARQPIMDATQSVFGYLLFDPSHQYGGHNGSLDAQFLLTTLTLAECESLAKKKVLFVRCTHDSLAVGHLGLAEAQHMVLEIPPLPISQIDRVGEFLPILREAKGRGIRLAFHYSILTSAYASWLPMATFISFDLAVLRPDALGNFVRLARAQSSADLIAMNVQSRKQFDTIRDMGVGLFQGDWFALPEALPDTRLQPTQSVILQLMDLVRQDVSVGTIETLLKRDPALSFNLLRFINSAGFGAHREVTSFSHAVQMLGLKRLFKWAALLMTTANATDAPPAVGATAVVRGRLMELLAQLAIPTEDTDNAFVVGIFSLLDTMLGIPMEQALQGISLPVAVCDVLLQRRGSLLPLLELTLACERADGAQLLRNAQLLGLGLRQISAAHLQAMAWAETLAID